MVLRGEVVREYIRKMPIEIRLPTMALKDERHWAVFLYLLEAGEQRFGEIGEKFEINSNNDLDPILKTLVEGGLVRRFMKDGTGENDRRATWYQVTELGEKYLDMLEELILPGKTGKREKSALTQPEGLPQYTVVVMKQPHYAHDQLRAIYLPAGRV